MRFPLAVGNEKIDKIRVERFSIGSAKLLLEFSAFDVSLRLLGTSMAIKILKNALGQT